MAELKTKPTEADIEAFIDQVNDEQKRDDCRRLIMIMSEISGESPKMWGPSIVGFGTYHYVYPTGNEGDWMLTGFSPRKQALTIYIMSGFEKFDELMGKLGKHKTGKSCLYVKKLTDIDESVLRELIKNSIETVKKRYAAHNH